jgi:uncharacterized membrane protein
MAVGYARLEPCVAGDWTVSTEFSQVCYSDIPVIYALRHAAFPAIPYRDYMFEYPIGTGAFAYVSAAITAGLRGVGLSWGPTPLYFSVSALLLAACGLAAIWWTSRMPGARRGDRLFLAVGMAVMGYMNWDLVTVALTAAAFYAWARERPYLCGLLLGWGAATKAYPALLLVPLFLVCVRERRLREFIGLVCASVLTWLALNAAYLLGPLRSGWTLFYTFSFHRDSDLGTMWNLVGHLVPGRLPGHELDLAVSISLVICTLAICAVALSAPRAPSLGQLSFLMIAAFLLTSKSWSPQYGLWLLPLAVLTRLPWRVLWVWLGVDVMFYVAVMWFVNGQIHGPGPEMSLSQVLVVVALHGIALMAMSVLVVRDIFRKDTPRPRDAVPAALDAVASARA